ncbi:hypothetical protein [Phocaeicola salanitronis]|uniref:hypothetical protein n=1 Tax=Phocaeicola salanitronis TaxID=376805 RepID=UPI00338FBC10
MEKQDVSKGEPDGDMPSDSPFSFTLQGIADNLPSFCAQYIELPNLCNTGKIPRNKLIRKLDIGDKDIYKEYYILLPQQRVENPLDRAATENGVFAAV